MSTPSTTRSEDNPLNNQNFNSLEDRSHHETTTPSATENNTICKVESSVKCGCGCVPKGMLSLFEMAQKRKEYLEAKAKATESKMN